MPPNPTVASLNAQVMELRAIILAQEREIARLREELEEIDPMVDWYSHIQTTTRAAKIAFGVVGALLGLIISILTIIQLWPSGGA